jgi:hypothetical protein
MTFLFPKKKKKKKKKNANTIWRCDCVQLWRYVASDLQVDPDRSDAGFRLRLHYSKYLFDFEVATLGAQALINSGFVDPTTLELARLAAMTPDERHIKVAASVAAAKANASLFAAAEFHDDVVTSASSVPRLHQPLVLPPPSSDAAFGGGSKVLPAIVSPLKDFPSSMPLDASPRAPFSFKAMYAGTSLPAPVGAMNMLPSLPASLPPPSASTLPTAAVAVATAQQKLLLPPMSAFAFDHDSGSASGSFGKRKFAAAAAVASVNNATSLVGAAVAVERRQARKKRSVALDSDDDDDDEDDLRKRKLPDYMTLQKTLNGAGVGRVRPTKAVDVDGGGEDADELSTISAFLDRLRGEFL